MTIILKQTMKVVFLYITSMVLDQKLILEKLHIFSFKQLKQMLKCTRSVWTHRFLCSRENMLMQPYPIFSNFYFSFPFFFTMKRSCEISGY